MENPHTKSINIPFMGFPPSFMYNIKYGIDQIKVGRYICLIIKSFELLELLLRKYPLMAKNIGTAQLNTCLIAISRYHTLEYILVEIV